MFSKVVVSLVIGILVFLACILVGGLLATTAVPFVVTVGAFLEKFAGLLGLAAALWNMFAGGFSLPNGRA